MQKQYTAEEKLKELERELMQRQRVYPRLIAREKMKKETAMRQTSILNEIIEDYKDKAKEGPLFNFAGGDR